MTHPRTTARASRRPAADRPWPKPLISTGKFLGVALLALLVFGLLGVWLRP
jgi:hypothetical protein